MALVGESTRVDPAADADSLFQATAKAASFNQVESMKLLKQFGARFEPEDAHAYLLSACRECQIDVVRWLLSLDDSYKSFLNSRLLAEVWHRVQRDGKNALELVELLLSHGIRFDRGFGSDIADFCSRGGRTEEVHRRAKVWPVLNRHGVDFISAYETGYTRDCIGGMKKAAKHVIRTERLYDSVASESVDSVSAEKLVALAKQWKSDVSVDRTRNGRSVLHAAIIKNNVEVAEWLVKRCGLSLSDPVDAENEIWPRDLALEVGNDDMISLLDELAG